MEGHAHPENQRIDAALLRVHARFTGILATLMTPRLRQALEHFSLLVALSLLAMVTVLHVSYVGQPGCAVEIFEAARTEDVQIVNIRVVGVWTEVFEKLKAKLELEDRLNVGEGDAADPAAIPEGSTLWASWANLLGMPEQPPEEPAAAAAAAAAAASSAEAEAAQTAAQKARSGASEGGPSPKGPLTQALISLTGDAGVQWIERFERTMERALTGQSRNADVPAAAGSLGNATTLPVDDSAEEDGGVGADASGAGSGLQPGTRKWAPGERARMLEEMLEREGLLAGGDLAYIYATEKGFLMVSDDTKARFGVKEVNVSVSAESACFGPPTLRFLLESLVGYDTVVINSVVAAQGSGYLYNVNTRELYNLKYGADVRQAGPQGGDVEEYLVLKLGVLVTSLFVFFTTTMSVSFTLRETQARMFKFTVQLQHHARHRLPTFGLIFSHVIESLVFVPIMIGILFFLFEFFDDQLLAFMVLTLVWLCEIFSMISARTRLSMRFFPRFFFGYFILFHIYFFSFAHGFSYVAFFTAAAFMHHSVLYFWNRHEVPALLTSMHSAAQAAAATPTAPSGGGPGGAGPGALTPPGSRSPVLGGSPGPVGGIGAGGGLFYPMRATSPPPAAADRGAGGGGAGAPGGGWGGGAMRSSRALEFDDGGGAGGDGRGGSLDGAATPPPRDSGSSDDSDGSPTPGHHPLRAPSCSSDASLGGSAAQGFAGRGDDVIRGVGL